jgi:hypothetical protein
MNPMQCMDRNDVGADKNKKCVAYPQEDFLFKIIHSASLDKNYVNNLKKKISQKKYVKYLNSFKEPKIGMSLPTEFAPEASKITGLKLNSKSFNLKKRNVYSV